MGSCATLYHVIQCPTILIVVQKVIQVLVSNWGQISQIQYRVIVKKLTLFHEFGNWL